MDVRLNRLLNSAERFVQDKKDTKDVSSNELSSKTPQKLESKSDFAISLPVQYHNIQTKLTELQKQLSREQSRLGLLEDPASTKEDLIQVLFENEPLFPELTSGNQESFQKADSLLNTQTSIKALVEELKKKEVEGENIFSLGMILNPEEFNGKLGQMSPSALKPISETVVKRLLGG
ncbi:LIC10415 family protein [Leptospira idonii]|uniref:Uncharacterized protein n=1 Tax=Leptospira idonii TaxID=1193500 RepID=A0A4R9LVW4_9LEPT|nr:hypothetical protein [Leptospira idonii]TGN17334.1 hypothetical protein EHS15_17525 [Leptospira idonii]